MKVTEPEVAQRYATVYRVTIEQAVAGASALMARLVAQARAALRELEARAIERRERERLTHSRRLLNQFESVTLERFAEELKTAFSRQASVERALPAAADLRFDQLGAMDAAQVRQRVEAARTQHAVQATADAALTELNRLICTMLGFTEVRLERNPLRPAVYVDALTAALSHLPVPAGVRQGWMSLMTAALGLELDLYYRQLCIDLRHRGVDADLHHGTRPESASGEDAAGEQPGEQAILTLEKLRQFVSDTPADSNLALEQRYRVADPTDDPVSAPAQLEPGDGALLSGFRPTVPAALDALAEMKQLNLALQRIEIRQAASSASAADGQPMLGAWRAVGRGPEQVLGQEVVAIMVDNIRHDQRLLAPVQALIAELEPALLQLALVDPRFFSHKQHPARRLLHEITHRSIAFESIESRGFSSFMEPLREAVAPLAAGMVETAEGFDQALSYLARIWEQPHLRDRRQVDKAVRALQTAEQRSALASIIIREVQDRADAALVPDAVLDFLCGPWAQVVAQARMNDAQGLEDPGSFAATIDDVMWSAQPELTRAKREHLQRMIPDLLQRLHAGLATIACPAKCGDDFFSSLQCLQQLGLDPHAELDVPTKIGAEKAAPRGTDFASSWLVPDEARASGFIDMVVDTLAGADVPSMDGLVAGAWVTLLAEGSWNRTRLVWISPNASLLLFSDALGTMQSLTRRACEHLFARGELRIISTDPVEDALDAVAQTAMRNSVDIRF